MQPGDMADHGPAGTGTLVARGAAATGGRRDDADVNANADGTYPDPCRAIAPADPASGLSLRAEHAAFGGVVRFYEHASHAVGGPMRFGVFLPAAAARAPVPGLLFLAGLTCNEETFLVKGGALAHAARLGLALVAPDTSPRAAAVPGEAADWDFGVGAGFYLDATQAPWATHWRMESYLLQELLPLVGAELPIDAAQLGIFGHSMGGHGALTLALRHPGRFRSVSAFAPICAPMRCAWGEKAFTGYLGADNRAAWAAHDASALLLQPGSPRFAEGILVDQGLADKFLASQLHPHLLEEACAAAGQPLPCAAAGGSRTTTK